MTPPPALPHWLVHFPGPILQLSPEGEVLASNGRAEAELGIAVVGRAFAELLDSGPSRAKWIRMVELAAGGGIEGWELILCAEGAPLEPRRFTLTRDPMDGGLWLVGHPGDPRVDGVHEAVMEVNSELVRAQRDLVRERGRLAAAMAELERSNQALDEFAHVVSHDLRTPLRAVANHARWIGEDLGPGAAAVAGHLEAIDAQVRRLQGYIGGILDYARVSRPGSSAPEPVDVAGLLDEVVAFLAPPSTARIASGGPLPVIVTERAPLLQVLLNLVGNALRHGGDAVRVEVSAEVRDATTAFSVADDGPGIPEAMRERVWGLFQRGATAADTPGTGIGLAVVKRLVEDRGGRAWIDDSPTGTMVRFTWPGHPIRGRTSGS